MRRARFAVSDGDKINERASAKDALTFDLRAHETADDESLAMQRVAMFDLAPALLGATHLVWGLACFLIHPTSIVAPLACNPLIPLISVLVLDGLAFAGLWFRDRIGLAPRTVAYGLGAYIGASGALWMAYGLTLDCTLGQSNTAFIALAFGAGLGAATIVSITHRPAVVQYHDRRWTIDADESGRPALHAAA